MTQGGSTSLGWEVCCYKNMRHLMIISKDMHMQLSLAPSILTPFSCQCAAGATALSSMGGRKTQSTRHTHTHTHICAHFLPFYSVIFFSFLICALMAARRRRQLHQFSAFDTIDLRPILEATVSPSSSWWGRTHRYNTMCTAHSEITHLHSEISRRMGLAWLKLRDDAR